MSENKNIIKYTDLGEVRFVHNSRARNLSIRINQQAEVRVTIPRYVSRRKAEAFLLSKRLWILAKLNELEAVGGKGRMLNEGEELTVRGKAIRVVMQKGENNMEEAIWRILLEEAREYLPSRVHQLSKIHGFEVTGVKIRRMRTRWGSCTAKNVINLNSWLVMLPDTLSDYVILHELVHTKHRDHSKNFWDALDGVTSTSSKQLRKELRNQRIMIF